MSASSSEPNKSPKKDEKFKEYNDRLFNRYNLQIHQGNQRI